VVYKCPLVASLEPCASPQTWYLEQSNDLTSRQALQLL
jgi:hypothetical protein